MTAAPEADSNLPITVVKVGGSLLSSRDLVKRMSAWIESRPPERRLYVIGGAQLVEQLRSLHSAEQLTEQFCHWSAIRLMSETAFWFQQLMRASKIDLPIVNAANQFNTAIVYETDAILDCQSFMKHHSQLPKDWSTTSDSIAAELASFLNAHELCLLKSTTPGSPSIATWAQEGVVDANFPNFAKPQTRITLFDLRDDCSLWIEGR